MKPINTFKTGTPDGELLLNKKGRTVSESSSNDLLCAVDSLTAIALVVSTYRYLQNEGKTTENSINSLLDNIEELLTRTRIKQPPPNDKWCIGCNPDNCAGCDT